jgi:HK97 gp10 family phage protein
MAKVEGLEKLKARFAAIPKEMKVQVRAAIEKSADELVAFQKRLAPDDPRTPAPDLKSSIRKRDGRHELSVEVFTDDFKARWLEFGTVKMSARPFFFGPYRTLRRRIKSRISRAVKKAVKTGA